MNANDFRKVPICEATRPPAESGTFQVQVNKWWAVTEDDCVLMYCESRQCNSDRRVVEHIITHEGHPGVKAVLLPHVYL